MAKAKKRKWIITYPDGSEVPYEGDDAFNEALKTSKKFLAELVADHKARMQRIRRRDTRKKVLMERVKAGVKLSDLTTEELDHMRWNEEADLWGKVTNDEVECGNW